MGSILWDRSGTPATSAWNEHDSALGVATDFGVECTARFAYEYGFQQIFAKDAMTSGSEEQHNAAMNFIFKRIGRVRKTDEILKARQ